MSYPLENKLVVGISARTLFDMRKENDIFEREGVEAYRRYQISREKEPLKPGPGFGLAKALLGLNETIGREQVEIIVLSHNCPDVSLRIFHSITHYGLAISRASFVSGSSLAPYLDAFHTDLFLSSCEADVQCAVDNGIAAGIICMPEVMGDGQVETVTAVSHVANAINYPFRETGQIRIAFDGDAVLFSEESEQIFQQKGLKAFEENEKRYVNIPLEPGPFARFLTKLSRIREEYPQISDQVRTALVTSRCAPAHERVIRTLRSWNVQIDEAFFLGGISKQQVLKAFGAHIYFDDQLVHVNGAASVVPVARVPYRSRKREHSKDEIQAYCTGRISGTA